MDAHAHTWPIWTVVLLSLSAYLWMSELPMLPGALGLLGHG